jgi:hypothetical protein
VRFFIENDKEAKENLEITRCDHLLKNIHKHLVNWTTINLETAYEINFIKKVRNPNNRLIIYKENSSVYINEAFEDIEFMNFKHLYRSKLTPASKKYDISSSVYLKVMDITIREEESLSKLASIYEDNEGKHIFNLVGRVVSEKMIFYKTMSDLKADEEHRKFQIDKYIGFNPKKYNQDRQNFRK